jgi:biotin synthase
MSDWTLWRTCARRGSTFAAAASSEWARAARIAPACCRPLANLPEHPQSLPINAFVPIKGTPLGDSAPIDGLEFVRTIAVARIVCPRSVVRLAAGRQEMSRELQAMCLMAGANSIFIGEKLLTTPLPGEDKDRALLAALGMRPMGEGSLGAPAARPPTAQ